MAKMHSVIADTLSNNQLVPAINLLSTVCKVRPKEIDQHIEAIMKVFTQKQLKDHLNYAQQLQVLLQTTNIHSAAIQQASSTGKDAYDAEVQTRLIMSVIDVLDARIEVLQENRRPYLTAIATLAERSHSEALCLKILDLVESWIFNSDGVPTLKEKVAVLTKMLMYEGKPDKTKLLKRFLDLVLRIYEDPRVTRTNSPFDWSSHSY